MQTRRATDDWSFLSQRVLTFADDTTLLSATWLVMMFMWKTYKKETMKVGLSANDDKTVPMVFAPNARGAGWPCRRLMKNGEAE